jgi:hypothetical protein
VETKITAVVIEVVEVEKIEWSLHHNPVFVYSVHLCLFYDVLIQWFGLQLLAFVDNWNTWKDPQNDSSFHRFGGPSIHGLESMVENEQADEFCFREAT